MRRYIEPLMGNRWVVWSVLGLAMVVLIVSSMTIWVKRQALDTNNWADVSARLLEDEEVRQVVAADLVDALFTNSDVLARVEAALPPRLAPLAGPAKGLLRDTATSAANDLLQRPAVLRLWRQANETAHAQLLALLDGEVDGRLLTDSGGDVVLDLRPLVEQLGDRIGIEARLAPGVGVVRILRADQLSEAQAWVKRVRQLSVVLAIVVLGLLALAVYLGRGFRREVLRATAVGLIAAGVLLLVVRRLVGDAVVDSLTSPATSSAGAAVWFIATDLLRDLAVAQILYGLVLLVGVLLAGPSRWATAVRGRLAPAMRHHVALVYAAVGALFLLFLLWAPSVGGRRLLGIVVLAALVAGGVEVLRRQILRESPAEP